MNSENLEILTDADIDYGDLSEDVLKKLALDDELFIATSALVELRLRESLVAAIIAYEILSESKGDKYLQATALSVLFETNQEQAINYMLKEAPSCEPYILNSIMELMIENEPDFKFVPASLLVTIVRERLRELENSTKFTTLEARDKFLHTYGHIQNIHTSKV
ncbi:hypothetical protein DSM106972_041370 [Dulcicalothrix desertica PCC 7102]|uniref:Immunity protein 30 domain-containing protein n=1 Tax=Dulcicalothrix desertica PCC 7102 TaxID=232991 RepID=A0A433VEQ7_9CYAN|nr:hypothetical protein [Dulcicalothrix desertica]RUT04568.1 hypothetical protein DSM106972_041370 [Dulcicalothrix desertica PCC 7102]TWH42579.1 hypothetical protein CAL7102_06248 [Dulcicalothrix desertica PCC 7102]